MKNKNRWLFALLIIALGSLLFWNLVENDVASQARKAMAGRPSVSEIRSKLPDYGKVSVHDLYRVSASSDIDILTIEKALSSSVQTDNLDNIDSLLQAFLAKGGKTRTEKVNELYSMQLRVSDIASRQYLLDYLSALQPIEVAGALISQFQGAQTSEEKLSLLRAIVSAFSFGSEFSLPPELLQEWEGIQSFYRNALSTTKEAVLLRELLQSAFSVLPADEAISIFQSKVDASELEGKDIADFYTNGLVADKEFQNKILRQLGEAFDQGTLSGARPFTERLSGLVTSDTDRTVFDRQALVYVLPMIQNNEPSLGGDIGASDASAYFRWSQLSQQIQHPNESDMEINTRLLRDATTSTDPLKTAALIVLLPSEQFGLISPPDALAIAARLEQSLLSPALSDSQRRLIIDAIAVLRSK